MTTMGIGGRKAPKRLGELVLATVLTTTLVLSGCAEFNQLEDDIFEYGANPERHQARADQAAGAAARAEKEASEQDSSATATFEPLDSTAEVIDLDDQRLTEAEFYSGDESLNQLRSTGAGGVAIDAGGSVSLNFVDADILEVVDVVLGETLGLNYVVDSRVQGTVTARTTRAVSRASLLAALENILALNNAALSRIGGVFNVVPLQEGAGAISRPVVGPRDRAAAQGFAIHLIPLNYVAASSLQDVLNRFVAPGRVLVVDNARNMIIFAGGSQEARDLSDLVETFDIDWLAGMSFALLPVETADVESMVGELEVVFGQDLDGPLDGVVRFLPIERLNAILVISSQAAYLRRAKLWVERLDRGSESAGRRIFVYYVRNARAADLSTILNQIFSEGLGETDRAGSQRDVAPGLRPVEIVGEQSAAEDADGGEDRAADPGDVAEGTGQGFGVGSLVSESNNIRVIADERNNALVILATPAEYRMIESTLKRLDILPLQVLIEATIAEVTLNDELRFGLQWFFRTGNFDISLSEAATGAVGSTFPGFNVLFSAGEQSIALDALSELTDVKVISSPQLMVLDNQSARLQVGDQVPIATQSSVAVTDPDSPIVNSIELQDTGVILEVTPHVNASGLVMLDIVQEVSDVVSTTTSTIDSPTIQQRRIESTVAVQSGETVALGGLIQDRDQTSDAGVPFLKDIPILGLLFSTRNDITTRTELLVMITPRVVRDPTQARDVTRELRERLRGLGDLELRIN